MGVFIFLLAIFGIPIMLCCLVFLGRDPNLRPTTEEREPDYLSDEKFVRQMLGTSETRVVSEKPVPSTPLPMSARNFSGRKWRWVAAGAVVCFVVAVFFPIPTETRSGLEVMATMGASAIRMGLILGMVFLLIRKERGPIPPRNTGEWKSWWWRATMEGAFLVAVFFFLPLIVDGTIALTYYLVCWIRTAGRNWREKKTWKKLFSDLRIALRPHRRRIALGVAGVFAVVFVLWLFRWDYGTIRRGEDERPMRTNRYTGRVQEFWRMGWVDR